MSFKTSIPLGSKAHKTLLNLHHILLNLLHLDAIETSDDIRVVVKRALDLVQELGTTGCDTYDAVLVLLKRDRELAVRRELNDGKAQI